MKFKFPKVVYLNLEKKFLMNPNIYNFHVFQLDLAFL
jgi:hypothetical protein